VDVLHSALQYWEYKRQKEVHYVTKGENSLTEMYSAIAADVEVDSDPRTKMNPALMSELTSAKRVSQ
jgi:hypothetical protein